MLGGRDCEISQTDPTCQGSPYHNYLSTYDTPEECCSKHLSWIPLTQCLADVYASGNKKQYQQQWFREDTTYGHDWFRESNDDGNFDSNWYHENSWWQSHTWWNN